MNKKEIAAQAAITYIKNNMILGLGTGSTVYYLLQEVSKLIKGGMNLKCVATSKNTEILAKELNIPIYDIDEVDRVDLTIDGVDEIDGNFDAIKGGGAALFREKIIASAAKEVIWIMDDSKVVDSLGSFMLPVEVLPFGVTHLIRKLAELGIKASLRIKDGNIVVTDNGNNILDLPLAKPIKVVETVKLLNNLVGVIEVGLFPNYCSRIIIGTNHGAKILENPRKS